LFSGAQYYDFDFLAGAGVEQRVAEVIDVCDFVVA
jgi:hypothetical protein